MMPIFLEVCKSSRDFETLLFQEYPNLKLFVHHMEESLDIQSAIATGGLQNLKEAGYLKTTGAHITNQKFQDGAYVWSMKWLSGKRNEIDRSSADKKLVESYNEIKLKIRVDKKEKKIDTEFFSLNGSVGVDDNHFDDREKLHVVWSPSKSGQLEINYIGMGTNEPYDMEHPEKSCGLLSNRPRFFIFDVENNYIFQHRVKILSKSCFQGDFKFKEILHNKDGSHTVDFLSLIDGSLYCYSDLEITAPGAVPDTFNPMHNTPGIRDHLNKVTYSVTPTLSSINSDPPEFSELLLKTQMDYLPYFYATSAARTTHPTLADISNHFKVLEESKSIEYQSIFSSLCSNCIKDEYLRYLPEKMHGLINCDLDGMPHELAEGIKEWRNKLSSEIDSDLYYCGQFPKSRISALMLGITLATDQRFGGIYFKYLDEANKHLNGEPVHGYFEIVLDPTEP